MFDDPRIGHSPIDTAKKCFAENNRLFGQTNVKKRNLYNGLANLAISIKIVYRLSFALAQPIR